MSTATCLKHRSLLGQCVLPQHGEEEEEKEP